MKRASQLTITVMTVVAFGGCQITGHTVPIKQEGGKAPGASATSQARVQEGYGALPLSFEANLGQTDPRVQFLARGRGYTLFLTREEAVMVLRAREEERGLFSSSRLSDLSGPEPSGSDPTRQTKETRQTKQTVLRMRLQGASPSPLASGLEPLPGIVNYFIGSDAKKWRTNIPTYKKVEYREVYPGVDLAYYGNQGKLEYDLIVAPGADPTQTKLAFEGADLIEVDSNGDLVLTLSLPSPLEGEGQGEGGARSSTLRLRKPLVYQLAADGKQQLVAGTYVLPSGGEGRIASSLPLNQLPTTRYQLPAIGIELAAYDHSRPLIIDPVLVYSTFLGGSAGDGGLGIAVDASGNAYVTGNTVSTDFPTTPGAFDTTFSSVAPFTGDAFVTKVNASGSGLVYSTFLGGMDEESPDVIAVDTAGNAYVTGFTRSADFPTTPGAFDTTFNGPGFDTYVTKLDPTGSALVYSTFLGGSSTDDPSGIAVGVSGNAYVTGNTSSTDFPTTLGAFATTLVGGGDGFVTKLNTAGSALVYSTFLGGSENEGGVGIAVDASGNAYVTGDTQSTDFPTTPGAFDTTFNGGSVGSNLDAFVTKLNAAGSALVYSTFLGGSDDDPGFGIAVDAAGNAYVNGGTFSTDFPTTPGAFDTTFGGVGDLFVTKLHAGGSALIYSTFLGGSDIDDNSHIAVDASGNAYVAGTTASTDFPTTPGAFATTLTGFDAFLTKLDSAGSALVYSTILGGTGGKVAIAVDASANVYVTGQTASTDFPTTPGAFDTTPDGVFSDAFVAKISVNTPSGTNVSASAGNGVTVTFTAVASPGETSAATSNTGPTPPAGFSLGTPPTYYEITTTATSTGPVTVCITYNPPQFGDPTMLQLLHFEGNAWVDVTTSNDTINFVICGEVSSFSLFVITESAVRRVSIDIKPGSFPNSINLSSHGTVPVAILSAANFDATTVNPTTVTLASAPVKLKGKGTPMASSQDVNGDSRLDLVVHVETEALELSPTDTIAVLEGSTFSNLAIRGTDSVRIVP